MISSASKPSPSVRGARIAPVLMEDHDGAYWFWKEAGLKDRVLFHFDAHIDFAWIKPPAEALLKEPTLDAALRRAREQPFWDFSGSAAEDRTHLGNYIHQAIDAGIVREFVWVYPDGTEPERQAEAVRGVLDGIAAWAPKELAVASAERGMFSGTLRGKPFRALPLSRLAEAVPEEEVLLDVDVDFFVVRSLSDPHYPWQDPARPSMWLAPEEFLARVAAAGLRFDRGTIAYSVEEGYTPAGLRFLGDELAARIAETATAAQERRWQALRRLHLEERKDSLLESIPPGEAPETDFNLALLHAAAGDFVRARELYESAVRAEPAYRSRYNHPGPVFERRGRDKEAAASYDMMRRLDPAHAGCRLREFELLLESREWNGAVSRGEELFAAGERDPWLLLGLAQAHLELRRPGRAREWTELCARAGVPPSAAARLWTLKARCAEALCLDGEALDCWRRVILSGARAPEAHRSLAWAYLKRGNFYKARRHAWKAFRTRERA